MPFDCGDFNDCYATDLWQNFLQHTSAPKCRRLDALIRRSSASMCSDLPGGVNQRFFTSLVLEHTFIQPHAFNCKHFRMNYCMMQNVCNLKHHKSPRTLDSLESSSKFRCLFTKPILLARPFPPFIGLSCVSKEYGSSCSALCICTYILYHALSDSPCFGNNFVITNEVLGAVMGVVRRIACSTTACKVGPPIKMLYSTCKVVPPIKCFLLSNVTSSLITASG